MDLKTLKDTPPWDWPEGMDQRLIDVLADARVDESERILAAELAGEFAVINDELANALLAILLNDDEPEELRAAAVISLGPAIDYVDTYEFEDPDEMPITEQTFQKIQESLRKLYMRDDLPKDVKRRILEASVRAPQDWHEDAIRAAFSRNDNDWILTAVFSMRWISGFDAEIVEALESEDEDVYYQAVCAAGNWEIDEAWPHVSRLVTSTDTEKSLLLAAIDAAAGIRPQEAGLILAGLNDSDDEDIVEAVNEAMAMAEELLDEESE
ncbi:MAG: hypothetical protein ABIK28_22735 [Planctomycetota bacterium]